MTIVVSGCLCFLWVWMPRALGAVALLSIVPGPAGRGSARHGLGFLRLPSRLGECLIDVGDQIVNVFDADRQPNHVSTNTCRFQLFIV